MDEEGHRVIDFEALQQVALPFVHWAGAEFVDAERVREVNAAWPDFWDPRWHVEAGRWSQKAAILFPERLPAPAQALAAELYSPAACDRISSMLGLQVQPDPWFLEGAGEPRLGGGLHEIRTCGLLKVHVDFEQHPSGLRRVANLLVYLNEDWRPEWGGALELHGFDYVQRYIPVGGFAVLFATTPDSWHGHPDPLACPTHRSRRSLALYYYAADSGTGERVSTVYRSKK
jgi:hypothetical protein